ncbi:RNA polymerase sigma factor RpoD/SigA [candidate division CSSED10-310 bacterium]|uniref:RNA polymerase sigma factor RpoD/SigA n=1 Tax=candidate division CSSED10-310 bacterium TaxID=2855610 RepID=A0ABV6Z2U8_UNCC1
MTSSENENNSERPSAEESTIHLYLREIGKYPLLSKEDELALARKAKDGDNEAFKMLIKSNLRFVVNIAKKYQCCGISLLDLINEGNIGLIEAAKRYNPDKGVKLISYAVWWIRQAIMQALADQAGAVRLPIKQAGLLYRIGEKYKELKQKLERDPTLEELATELGIEATSIEPILRASRFSLSLESQNFTESGYSLLASLPNLDQVSALDNSLKTTLYEDMKNLLLKLDPREREILQLHYGLADGEPQTLEEIGKKFGLSRERIRQIESRAKKKLLKMADKGKLEDYLN